MVLISAKVTTGQTGNPTTGTASTKAATGSGSLASSAASLHTYTTSILSSTTSHTQAAYPTPTANPCGDWVLVDNVCCPLYCSNQNESSSCDSTCTGTCVSPPGEDCMSGDIYPPIYEVTTNEPYHYSVCAFTSKE
jgi:hypothetical protein